MNNRLKDWRRISQKFWDFVTIDNLNLVNPAIRGACAVEPGPDDSWHDVIISGVWSPDNAQHVYARVASYGRNHLRVASTMVLRLDQIGPAQRLVESMGQIINDPLLGLYPDIFNAEPVGWRVEGRRYCQPALRGLSLSRSCEELLDQYKKDVT